MGLDILITLVFVALNAFFVAAEFAIVKIRPSQLEALVRAGNSRAIATRHILERLDSYLSACQLGITLASLGLGWIGESVVAKLILKIVHAFDLNLDETAAHAIAIPVAFALITILHIVLGEQAPKYLGIKRPERTSLATAIPLKWFYFLFKPFIFILNKLSNMVVRMFGINPTGGHEVHTPQELLYLLEESRSSGTITSAEHTMVANVFDFYDRHARQIMRHRVHIIAVDIDWPMDKIFSFIASENYTRYPVYRDTIDNIIGIVHSKDLLNAMAHDKNVELEALIRPPIFIPDTKPIGKLLRDFQSKHTHMAIVVDEFGGVSGIITLEDILEELVGEIQDEYDEETPWVIKKNKDVFHIQAASNIIDANEQLPLPLPEGEDYETVGGYMNLLFGRVPEEGEKVESKDYIFEIVKKSGHHVDEVKATVKARPQVLEE